MNTTFQFLYKVVIPAFLAALIFFNSQSDFIYAHHTAWLIVALFLTAWVVFNVVRYAVNWTKKW